MILAAGLGKRMRPLTEHTPKPLLKVGGKPLIEYHLERLATAGIDEVIINTAYLGEQLPVALGDGSRWRLTIHYSAENEPLETGGGISRALPLLGEAPFLLINGDIWTDFSIERLLNHDLGDKLGHLVLVYNPEHHPQGDYSIQQGLLIAKQQPAYTFSGISVIHPALIADYPQRRHRFPLGEVFAYTIDQQQLSAEHYSGEWCDIGTVERLTELDQRLSLLSTVQSIS